MVDTPGRCRELDYCSIGQMRTLVRVPLGNPFVCPECGKPLREPVLINEPLSRKRLALWGLGTLGVFVLLYECVGPSAPKHHVTLAELQQEQARRAAALPPAALPAPPVKPAPKPLAPKPLAAAPLPAALATPPAPARIAVAPAAPPPAATAPGVKVTMECSIDAAGVPSNCTPAPHHDLPPVPTLPQPAAPPLPAPLLPVPPLPALKPAAAPQLAPAKPPAAQPSTQQAAVPPPAPPPPAPRPEHEPSLEAVSGGRPAYPTDYVRDGRAGEVSITCMILASGEPQNCRVSDYIGGRRFAEAVVKWLNTGIVRFEPARRDGTPVAEERHWHITFPPR
jgi:hypothetical protein